MRHQLSHEHVQLGVPLGELLGCELREAVLTDGGDGDGGIGVVHARSVPAATGEPHVCPYDTPMDRIIRTATQLIVALAGIVPAVILTLEEAGIEVNTRGLVALAGVATLVVTTVQNVLEEHGIIKPWRKD